MPKQSFSHVAVTPASVGQVWAALDEPATWESIGGVDRVFNPKIDEVGRLLGFSFETVVGGTRYLGEATPHERVEGRSIAWTIKNKDIEGLISVEIADSSDGTSIEVSISLASASFMASMFFPMIAGALGAGLPKAVEEFAAGFGRDGEVRDDRPGS